MGNAKDMEDINLVHRTYMYNDKNKALIIQSLTQRHEINSIYAVKDKFIPSISLGFTFNCSNPMYKFRIFNVYSLAKRNYRCECCS